MTGANCRRWGLRIATASLAAVLILNAAAWAAPETSPTPAEKELGQGALRIVQQDGGVVECPLKHTDVHAEISGFIARVQVTQTFHNPTKEKIEAVYVFPLPHEAAVDQMTMLIGDRKIVGQIKRRQEARAIYDEALAAGQTAALLEQERPNIFTQSVGNIDPEEEVKIELSYVDVLRYDAGSYEFHFPMVVGPRYIPGTPSGNSEPRPADLQGKVSPPVANTDRVPDAQRISPPVLKPGMRTGHDISLAVSLDAAVPIQDLKAVNHRVDTKRIGESQAAIQLAKGDNIPNKDFVLRYAVVGKKPAMAMLAHTGSYTDTRRLGTGYFMLMIQPAEDERLTKSPPREIVFLVDVSGSMSGEPTAKVIEAMQSMLKLCRPIDTVQVITFASEAHKLFEKPVPVVPENIQRALDFTAGLQGGGGTEMLKGVKLAIDEPIDAKRLRIVVMLTDGYIGNEAEIIEHVGKHCGDQVRFWCIGIGSSPNMFLVDGVARQGGGMGKKLELRADTEPLTQEVMTRIQRAQLAGIDIDWGDLKVSETYPAKLPELWAGRPVILFGRYSGGGRIAGNQWQAEIKVSGKVEGEAVKWPLSVTLPTEEPKHDVLAKTWARQKIEDLMQQVYYQASPAVEESVTAIALDYGLMSQYTSFVAVDAADANKQTEPARLPRRMLVPVPLPEGTRWEGFFGEELGDLAEGKAFDALSIAGQPLRELAKEAAGADFGRPNRLSEATPLFAGRDRFHRGASIERLQRTTQLGVALQQASKPALPTPAAAAPMPGNRLSFYRLGRSASGGMGVAGSGFGGGGFGGFGGGGAFGGAGGAGGLGSDSRRLAILTDSVAPAAERAERGYTAEALTAQGQATLKLAQDAQKALEVLKEREGDDIAALRPALLRCYFLDLAAMNAGQSDGAIASAALAELLSLREKEVSQHIKQLPNLERKLDLVLRDMSIGEALAAVGEAAGLPIKLLEGSIDDAASLLHEMPRITYLDLRRATARQAIDWILQPARLNWWLDNGRIVAGTDRRREGVNAWIYDVADIALPLTKELEPLDDPQKAVAAAQREADAFLTGVRKEVAAPKQLVVWYAPGELLVLGHPQTHEKTAKMLTSLRSPGAKRAGSLADKAFQRITARQPQIDKARDTRRLLAISAAHENFGWQLLAAAAAGRLDDEALTELTIAWRDPATARLLEHEGAAVALRSLWIVCEAARSLPQQGEPSALAETARQLAQSARQRSLASIEKNPNDELARLSVLYSALALPDDEAYRQTALARFETAGPEPTSVLPLLARALLSEPSEADRQALASLTAERVHGSDYVVLAALACRRAGDTTWRAFRSASRDLVGGQFLPGEVVVFVNELSASPLRLASESANRSDR